MSAPATTDFVQALLFVVAKLFGTTRTRPSAIAMPPVVESQHDVSLLDKRDAQRLRAAISIGGKQIGGVALEECSQRIAGADFIRFSGMKDSTGISFLPRCR